MIDYTLVYQTLLAMYLLVGGVLGFVSSAKLNGRDITTPIKFIMVIAWLPLILVAHIASKIFPNNVDLDA